MRAYFIEDPNGWFHIREIAKLAGLSPTTATSYLEDFRKRGILLRKKERNNVLYKANSESYNYKDLKLYYNIKKFRDSGLINFLNEEFNYPKAIILFGSFRKAENTKESDVDLFILSPIKKEASLENFEKKLKHKIQLFVYSREEFDNLKKKNKELLNNILNGISLDGFLEVF